MFEFGTCQSDGTRPLLATFTSYSESTNPGLIHPYGLAVNSQGHVFTANQGSNLVVAYDGNTGAPLPVSPALSGQDFPAGSFYMGTNLTAANVSKEGGEHRKWDFGHLRGKRDCPDLGIRGIVFDSQDMLYVANKYSSDVAIVDQQGYLAGKIPVPQTYGIMYYQPDNLILVGSLSFNGTAAVVGYSVATNQFTKVFSDSQLTHPTGFTVYGDTLYVGDLNLQAIFAFSYSQGNSLGILTKVSDVPEFIQVSPC